MPEERQITTYQQLQDDMCDTLGGRAAEELFIGKMSTGAANDLERVTKQAYAMVVYYGMSEQLPNMNYYDATGQDWGFHKPYSDETAHLIDNEVKRIINEQYVRAKKILMEHKEQHRALTEVLLDKEVIYADDLEKIFGKRQWLSRSQEILAQQTINNPDEAAKALLEDPKEEKKEKETSQ
jgi:cell division protease FtsH